MSRSHRRHTRGALVCLVAFGAAGAGSVQMASAQAHVEPGHEIAWNRYYTVDEIHGHMRALARAYPGLIELRSIGESPGGREMLMAILTGPGVEHTEKPAMWIDGNIHANEIQAAEVVLYSLWYAATHYGHTDAITELLDDYAFYLLPVVNPDSRDVWFTRASTPHSPRGNQIPQDDDRDGLVDEDPEDDLDGDGSITSMWKRDPRGRYVRDRFDPRVFERVPEGEDGDWTYLGWEGLDNDGDGRINEDGTTGHDMNRNWPADWQPDYVQRGAGAFPLSAPETRAIAEFCYAHPNIAAFQSYHNTGGMVLRGPGASYRAEAYPREDIRVYNEFGEVGEDLLPYYRYLVIHADLYTVHGGEATWAAESLGVISFTNELWTAGKYFQRDENRPSDEKMWLFRDKLQFGQAFTDYTAVEHPTHGEVLVGGLNKWASRSTPTFMLEEECHRNFAFTAFHAGEMPKVRFDRRRVERLSDELWSVTVEIRNEKIIPTRTARAERAGLGRADLLTCEPAGDGRVVASGRLRDWWDTTFSETRHEPERVRLGGGVPGRGTIVHRFLVEGAPGERVTVRFSAEKAKDIELKISLEEGESADEG